MIQTQDILTNLANQIAEQVKASCSLNINADTKDRMQYYTVDDICKLLHIAKATYYRHKDLGLITPTAYVGRKPLFNQQAIDNYLAKFC